jgi:CTP:molybdopterin cytidylyltransferase MocA
VAGLVLAAGAGSRFGAAKQLARFRGRPLVERPLQAMAGAGLDGVFVVLGAEADRIAGEADLAGAEVVRCTGWADGQSASLRAGLRAADAAGAGAVVVVLADQPLVEAAAIRRVVATWAGEPAVQARYRGVPGHPTLLARALWPRLSALEGDRGAGELLRGEAVTRVDCDGLGSADDADTPEELAALERRAR